MGRGLHVLAHLLLGHGADLRVLFVEVLLEIPQLDCGEVEWLQVLNYFLLVLSLGAIGLLVGEDFVLGVYLGQSLFAGFALVLLIVFHLLFLLIFLGVLLLSSWSLWSGLCESSHESIEWVYLVLSKLFFLLLLHALL